MSPRSPRLVPLLASLSVTLFAALGAPGCADAGAQTTTPVEATDLPCADYDPTLDEWASAGWFGDTCDWTRFPANTTLDVAHPLGRIPKTVLIYIAFSEDGASATLASGNAGLIQGATDQRLLVRNDTNQRFYVRLVAR